MTSWQDWQALGYDQHSIIADPGFKDPAKGDFSLPEDSPARQIDFKPFPLDEAGQGGPRLLFRTQRPPMRSPRWLSNRKSRRSFMTNGAIRFSMSNIPNNGWTT